MKKSKKRLQKTPSSSSSSLATGQSKRKMMTSSPDLITLSEDEEEVSSKQKTQQMQQQFRCIQCNSVFGLIDDLEVHVTSEHLKWIPYKCNYCPQHVWMPTEAQLRRHLNENHPNQPPKLIFIADDTTKSRLNEIMSKSLGYEYGKKMVGNSTIDQNIRLKQNADAPKKNATSTCEAGSRGNNTAFAYARDQCANCISRNGSFKSYASASEKHEHTMQHLRSEHAIYDSVQNQVEYRYMMKKCFPTIGQQAPQARVEPIIRQFNDSTNYQQNASGFLVQKSIQSAVTSSDHSNNVNTVMSTPSSSSSSSKPLADFNRRSKIVQSTSVFTTSVFTSPIATAAQYASRAASRVSNVSRQSDNSVSLVENNSPGPSPVSKRGIPKPPSNTNTNVRSPNLEKNRQKTRHESLSSTSSLSRSRSPLTSQEEKENNCQSPVNSSTGNISGRVSRKGNKNEPKNDNNSKSKNNNNKNKNNNNGNMEITKDELKCRVKGCDVRVQARVAMSRHAYQHLSRDDEVHLYLCEVNDCDFGSAIKHSMNGHILSNHGRQYGECFADLGPVIKEQLNEKIKLCFPLAPSRDEITNNGQNINNNKNNCREQSTPSKKRVQNWTSLPVQTRGTKKITSSTVRSDNRPEIYQCTRTVPNNKTNNKRTAVSPLKSPIILLKRYKTPSSNSDSSTSSNLVDIHSDISEVDVKVSERIQEKIESNNLCKSLSATSQHQRKRQSSVIQITPSPTLPSGQKETGRKRQRNEKENSKYESDTTFKDPSSNSSASVIVSSYNTRSSSKMSVVEESRSFLLEEMKKRKKSKNSSEIIQILPAEVDKSDHGKKSMNDTCKKQCQKESPSYNVSANYENKTNDQKSKTNKVDAANDQKSKSKISNDVIFEGKNVVEPKEFFCALCNTTVKISINKTTHVRREHLNLPGAFGCPLCSQKASTEKIIEIHLVKVHNWFVGAPPPLCFYKQKDMAYFYAKCFSRSNAIEQGTDIKKNRKANSANSANFEEDIISVKTVGVIDMIDESKKSEKNARKKRKTTHNFEKEIIAVETVGAIEVIDESKKTKKNAMNGDNNSDDTSCELMGSLENTSEIEILKDQSVIEKNVVEDRMLEKKDNEALEKDKEVKKSKAEKINTKDNEALESTTSEVIVIEKTAIVGSNVAEKSNEKVVEKSSAGEKDVQIVQTDQNQKYALDLSVKSPETGKKNSEPVVTTITTTFRPCSVQLEKLVLHDEINHTSGEIGEIVEEDKNIVTGTLSSLIIFCTF